MMHPSHPKQVRHSPPIIVFVLLVLLALVSLYATGYFFGVWWYHSLQGSEHTPDNATTKAKCVSQQEMLRNTRVVASGTLERLKGDRDVLKRKLKFLEGGGYQGSGPASSCGGKASMSNSDDSSRESDKGSVIPDVRREATLLDNLTRETERWLKKAGDMKPSLMACDESSKRYSVVFDAGSTGSRVHVYRYNLTTNLRNGTGSATTSSRGSLLPYLRLENELFVENHEPLSGFSDPTKAAATLSPLLEAAKAYVPRDLQPCVGIELKATAGLRRVGAKQAENILNAVRREFRRGPFWLRSELDSVRILEGREEGPLAWLTVNFLIGALDGEKETATILDLGGGSTQVVMRPDRPEVLNLHNDFTDTFKMNGKSIRLYQHSYEGNGLNAARQQLVDAVSDGKEVHAGAHPSLLHAFPCFPQGYVYEKGVVSNGVGKDGVQPSMEKCVALFQRYVVRSSDDCGSSSCGFNGVFQPDVRTDVSGPVYAFSFYHDLLKPHMKPGTMVIRLREIVDIANNVCSSMKSAKELREERGRNTALHPSLRPEWECLHLSYVVALLREGIRYPLEQKFHIAKKINGYEAQWTLGSSLASLENRCR